jgi:hypothetical protein
LRCSILLASSTIFKDASKRVHRDLPNQDRSRRRLRDRVAMITSMHALIYSDDVDATRTFLRDVLGFPFVNDSGTSEGSATGWLIFRRFGRCRPGGTLAMSGL